MLELFCGEAPLACHARDQHKIRIFALDYKRENVWQHRDENNPGQTLPGRTVGVPACGGTNRPFIGAKCPDCNRLHEDELIPGDFINFPLDHKALDALLGGRRRVHWVHIGLECDTFSRMNQSFNQRNMSTFFMGDSQKVCTAIARRI